MKKSAMYSVIVSLAIVSLAGFTRTACAEDAAPSPAGAPADAPADTMADTTATEMYARPTASGGGEDKWTFTSPLYLWAVGLTGTATLKGNTLTVDESFTELADHLDQGFTAYLQLAKPQYGFYVNPNYYGLNFSGKIGPIKSELDLQLWIIEMAGYYRIWEYAGTRPADLYVVAGARYWNLHENLRIKGSGHTAETQWLLDPMIGLRFNEAITQRLHFMTQADIGGFNLAGQTSRFSWQWMANLGYDFTMPVIKKPSTVFVGWRQINVQKTSGSSTVNQTAFNLNFSGIQVGLNVALF